MTDSSPPLNQAFVDRLRQLARHLAWQLTRGAEGSRGAAHNRTGGASTFEGHRRYTPGDDPRQVDWHAFARSDQLVLKLFRRDTESTVDVLVDRSASMATGSNALRALEIGAALAYVGLVAGHRVRFAPLAGESFTFVGPFQGAPQADACLARFVEAAPTERGTFADGLRAYLSRVARPGAVVIVTDGIGAVGGADGLAPMLDRLGRRAGEASLFHCVDALDLTPTLDGAVLLEDAESGASFAMHVDEAVRTRYRALVSERVDAVERAARGAGIDYRFVDPAASTEQTVLAWHHRRRARGL